LFGVFYSADFDYTGTKNLFANKNLQMEGVAQYDWRELQIDQN
jgi:hypothetical protein